MRKTCLALLMPLRIHHSAPIHDKLLCSYPILLQYKLHPLFSSYLIFFSCWLCHIHYHINSHAISKFMYLASSSTKHFLFYSECPHSQFGHKPPANSHLNSGIKTLAINFTLNELTQTYFFFFSPQAGDKDHVKIKTKYFCFNQAFKIQK